MQIKASASGRRHLLGQPFSAGVGGGDSPRGPGGHEEGPEPRGREWELYSGDGKQRGGSSKSVTDKRTCPATRQLHCQEVTGRKGSRDLEELNAHFKITETVSAGLCPGPRQSS